MSKIIKHGTYVCLVCQLLLSIIIVWNGSDIPIHWNLYGEIDAYGSRINVIMLVFLNVLSAVLLKWLSKHPEACNFPQPFNNREAALSKMSEIVLCVGFYVSVIFLYITFSVVIRKMWIWGFYLIIAMLLYTTISGIKKSLNYE